MLQWGHRLTSVETIVGWGYGDSFVKFASMGPPTYIGGNIVSFGACTANSTASMGPPTYIGGNFSYAGVIAKSICSASMGPPTYIGGNHVGEPHANLHCTLQWGHRLTSVETTSVYHVNFLFPEASMGPPTYIGGNLNISN